MSVDEGQPWPFKCDHCGMEGWSDDMHVEELNPGAWWNDTVVRHPACWQEWQNSRPGAAFGPRIPVRPQDGGSHVH